MPAYLINLALFVGAAAATALLALAIRPVAERVGLVDRPGHRKWHAGQTPMTGGPAIFLVLLALAAWQYERHPYFMQVMSGAALVFMIGLVDDLKGLTPGLRFLIQAIACLLLLTVSGIYLGDFGQLIWAAPLELGAMAVPLTVFAALGLVNAYNMIDGMDGLSGTVFLVAGIPLTLLAHLAGHAGMVTLLVIVQGTVAGYLLLNARLPWNPRGRVFLGDAGSLMLGFILAWCLIAEGSGEERSIAPMTAVWLVAVPLLDTSTLIRKRWREGRNVFEADQYHLHHAFMRVGFSVGQTWICITALASFFAAVGLTLELLNAPDYLGFYLFMVFAFAYYFTLTSAWKRQRFVGRDFIYQDFVVEEAWPSMKLADRDGNGTGNDDR